MASQADIAAAMIAGTAPPSGNSDTGFEIGQIVSWDELSGVNTITVRGTTMNNLKCIQSGIGVLYQPGDTVAIFRFQTNYFVWGKIAAPGASAATQIRSSSVAASVNCPIQDRLPLPGSAGPDLNAVYIGSSCRCLVLISSVIGVNNTAGAMTFSVSGASTIAGDNNNRSMYNSSSPGAGTGGIPGGNNIYIAGSRVILLTASDGLNQGFNNFQSLYTVVNNAGGGSAGTGAFFQARSLTVIPF
jgi:hypothetical protein